MSSSDVLKTADFFSEGKMFDGSSIASSPRRCRATSAIQCEIGVGANKLVKKADEVQILKYALHNVGARHNKSVTFMFLPATSMRACRKRAYTTLAVSSNTPRPSTR